MTKKQYRLMVVGLVLIALGGVWMGYQHFLYEQDLARVRAEASQEVAP